MQTALCQEVNVPQVLLKSIALLDLSCICFWERTQLLFILLEIHCAEQECGVECTCRLGAGTRQQHGSSLHPPSLASSWICLMLD